jgi:hypothetical protein
MDFYKRGLLYQAISDDNTALMEEILEESTEDYFEVEAMLQKYALGQREYSLVSSEFPFQELLYIIEKERISGLVTYAVENGDFELLYEYLSWMGGIRRPAIVFELLCEIKSDMYERDIAQLAHKCIQRMYGKRSVVELLSMIREAYPGERFRNLLIEFVFRELDSDFIYFLCDLDLALLLDREERITVTPDQRLLLDANKNRKIA